jgi:hypothetical protein
MFLQIDVQTISIMIAAGSVVVGVIMSVLSIRNFTKSRQASVFLDFHRQATREFIEDMSEVLTEWHWTGVEDFMEKYGPRTNMKAYAKFLHIGSFFDSMGKLVESKVTTATLIPETLAVFAMGWFEKMESIKELSTSWRRSELTDSVKTLYLTLKKMGYRSPVPPREQTE